MQIIKRSNEYTIIKKRSGRYGVRNKHNVWINGEEKIKVLTKLGFVLSVKNNNKKSEENIDNNSNNDMETENN